MIMAKALPEKQRGCRLFCPCQLAIVSVPGIVRELDAYSPGLSRTGVFNLRIFSPTICIILRDRHARCSGNTKSTNHPKHAAYHRNSLYRG